MKILFWVLVLTFVPCCVRAECDSTKVQQAAIKELGKQIETKKAEAAGLASTTREMIDKHLSYESIELVIMQRCTLAATIAKLEVQLEKMKEWQKDLPLYIKTMTEANEVVRKAREALSRPKSEVRRLSPEALKEMGF